MDSPFLLSIFMASSVAFGSEVGSFPSTDGRYVATISVPDGEPELASRKVTTLVIKLAEVGAAARPAPLVGPPAPPLQVEALHFTALMPAHAHGMLLKPEITQTAPEEFRIQGVKLHMRGAWEITLEATLGKEPAAFKVPVTL